MNCLPKPNESLIIYQYGIWDEGPRVNASKSLGKEIIATIINRLSEAALRLLNEIPPLQS